MNPAGTPRAKRGRLAILAALLVATAFCSCGPIASPDAAVLMDAGLPQGDAASPRDAAQGSDLGIPDLAEADGRPVDAGASDLAPSSDLTPSTDGGGADLSLPGCAGFGSVKLIPLPHTVSSVAIGDLDGDGHQDIVETAYTESALSVLFGDGKGGFANPVIYPQGCPLHGVANGDLNGDGRLDVVVIGCQANVDNVQVFMNQGQGKLAAPVSYGGNLNQRLGFPQLTDFNNDGKLDVAVANPANGAFDPGSIAIFLGKGNGMLGPPLISPGDLAPWQLASADFNGDGRLDLAAYTAEPANPGPAPATILMLGDGKGGLTKSQTISQPGVLYNLLGSADINEDGHADLLIAGTKSLHAFWGPAFLQESQFPFPAASWVAIGDINGDGHADVAGIGNEQDDLLAVALGDGRGGLAAATICQAGDGTEAVAIGDLDGDGKDDVVVGNGPGKALTVFLTK